MTFDQETQQRIKEKLKEDPDYYEDIPFTREYLENTEGLWETSETEGIYLSLNRKALAYFKSTGKGYLNRLNVLVNDLLKDYVNKQKLEGVI